MSLCSYVMTTVTATVASSQRNIFVYRPFFSLFHSVTFIRSLAFVRRMWFVRYIDFMSARVFWLYLFTSSRLLCIFVSVCIFKYNFMNHDSIILAIILQSTELSSNQQIWFFNRTKLTSGGEQKKMCRMYCCQCVTRSLSI